MAIPEPGVIRELSSLSQVFAASLFEKFIPIVPSYVLFPAIGGAASGLWDLSFRCLTAALGSVGGAAAWYFIGASIGASRIRALVARHGHWLSISLKLYDQISRSYERHPFLTTLICQLIPTVRIFQALPAGVLRLRVAPFLFATGFGSLCWIAPLAAAGHVLRRHGYSTTRAGLLLLAALLMIEIGVYFFVRRIASKRNQKALAAN